MEETLNLKTERIKSLVTIIVTAIVNVLNVYGWSIDAQPIILGVTSLVSAGSIAVCWWFNQNWTKAAIKGQETLNAEKAKEKEEEK